MKSKIRLAMVIVFTLIGILTATESIKAQPGMSVSFQAFYDDLSPYGQWIDDPGYGYVWAPSGEQGFRPYFTGGHWVMTEYGNMWVSDYNWGWAPFHYGRWTYDSFYGWIWIPGYEWGPAWVSWRTGPSYYGWAPLGPHISVSFNSYNCPNDWWVFVPPLYIHHSNFHNYYYGPRNNSTYIHNTTIINNTIVNNNVTYYTGPRAREIEQVTHQPVQVRRVRDENTAGKTEVQKDAVAIYRPQVKRETAGARLAPPKAVKAEHPVGNPQAVGSGTTRTRSADKENPRSKNDISPRKDNDYKAVPPAAKSPAPVPPGKKNDREEIKPVPPGKNPPPAEEKPLEKRGEEPQQMNPKPDDRQPPPQQQEVKPQQEQKMPEQNNKKMQPQRENTHKEHPHRERPKKEQ